MQKLCNGIRTLLFFKGFSSGGCTGTRRNGISGSSETRRNRVSGSSWTVRSGVSGSLGLGDTAYHRVPPVHYSVNPLAQALRELCFVLSLCFGEIEKQIITPKLRKDTLFIEDSRNVLGPSSAYPYKSHLSDSLSSSSNISRSGSDVTSIQRSIHCSSSNTLLLILSILSLTPFLEVLLLYEMEPQNHRLRYRQRYIEVDVSRSEEKEKLPPHPYSFSDRTPCL